MKLERVPRFGDGWSEVLEALRERKYFTSTGEVLISSFRVDGEEFPGQIPFSDADQIRVTTEKKVQVATLGSLGHRRERRLHPTGSVPGK